MLNWKTSLAQLSLKCYVIFLFSYYFNLFHLWSFLNHSSCCCHLLKYKIYSHWFKKLILFNIFTFYKSFSLIAKLRETILPTKKVLLKIRTISSCSIEDSKRETCQVLIECALRIIYRYPGVKNNNFSFSLYSLLSLLPPWFHYLLSFFSVLFHFR